MADNNNSHSVPQFPSTTIGLLVPTSLDQFAPQSAMNAYQLLQNLGFTVYYPQEMASTGMELYNQGDYEGAKVLGETMIESFDKCRYIVSLSSATVVYIQQHFPKLFHNTTFHNDYRQFIDRCFDLTDFLANIANLSDIAIPEFPHKVTILDHCTTLRDYTSLAHPGIKGLRNEPRQILSMVPGLQLVEMPQQNVCCGYGGSFANNFTTISDSLAQRKVDNALLAGAEVITSTEPACLLHLESYIKKRDIKLEIRMIGDFLIG